MSNQRIKGLTYLELIVAIVIIGIALAGVIKTINATMINIVNPLQRQQATAIAESYLEEILAQPYLDPTTSTVCPGAPASRALFDNVCDYNSLNDVGARDQMGNPITGLEQYKVQVAVSQNVFTQRWYTGGGGSFVIENTAEPALEVTVTVTFGGDQQTIMSGYRTNY